MSQMLCEVINDEENFIEEPVEFVPCELAKGETNRDHQAEEFGEFKRINSPGNNKLMVMCLFEPCKRYKILYRSEEAARGEILRQSFSSGDKIERSLE